jgi:Tfp pilus assembly protein PilN
MPADLNLIPEQEVQQQTKVKLVKLSTIISILLLIVIALVSAYFYYETTQVKSQIKLLNSDIDALRTKINSMASIEISTRNLEKKYTVLDKILKDRDNYSLLMTELESRKPGNVNITTFDIRNDKLNVAGTGTDYISISSYISNLLNKNFEGGNAALKNLFTSVSLNEVSLESKTNNVNFTIVVTFNETLLKKQ